ncbi:MAG: imidazolonepropionase-like amidohydrolase [Halobacteriales archaeon]|jgi:imidazolonepropionase-like amidohydrolase
MLVLSGGTVVDADGSRDADVVVENGRIERVGTAPSDPDRTIDVRGQYVAPGLIDTHVHLMMDGGPDPESNRDVTEFEAAYQAASNLEDAVKTGVTTLRDLGSLESLAIDAGAAVEEGLLHGPRVQACGETVVMTGGHGHWFGREADGPDEVRKAAREQLKRGADAVKTMATGGVLTEGALTGAPELSERELEALVDVAEAKGRPTAAHAHGTEGIKNATRAGITSIEHGTFMEREAARLMAERGTYWVPTAAALHGIVDEGTEAGIPEWAVEKAEAAAEAFDDAFDYALEEDVPIAMGTDAGTPFNFFGDIPQELELLVDHGLSPTQAFEAATLNAADLLGLDAVGLVTEGYRADLVVLPDDPREDATAWQSVDTVVADGTVVT